MNTEQMKEIKSELQNERNELRDSKYQLDTLKVRREQEVQILMAKNEALEKRI